jgi:hypothetical protein
MSRRRSRSGPKGCRCFSDFATRAPGYIAGAAGHVSIVGAFIAAPGAADAIGEAVKFLIRGA